MSQIEEPIWNGSGYTIIAWANDQKPIHFQEFGSYQGEWLMLTKGEGFYFVYKDYYGSCSGCDALQAASEDGKPWTLSRAKDFAKDYKSFTEIPVDTMKNLIKAGTLRYVFPANVSRSWRDDGLDYDAFLADAVIAVKNEEDLDLTCADILACKNQEIKQTSLRRFGYERFIAEANMVEIDRVGEDALLKRDDIVFAYVKDASTPRRYLLRVPPTMVRLRQAIAWSFNILEDDYNPIVET